MKLIPSIVLFYISLSLSGQSIYYSNVNNNRISRDSLVQLINSEESKNSDYHYRAIIVDSTFNNDSIIFRVVIERSKNEEFPEKIQRSIYLDLHGEPFSWENFTNLDSNSNFSADTSKLKLVNFWFTDCPPCLAEIPFLNQLKAEFSNEIQFIAITFEPSSRIKAFLSHNDFDFIHFIEARSQIDRLGVDSYPISFLIDKKSNVLKVYSGFSLKDSVSEPYSSNAKALLTQLKFYTGR